MSAETIFQLSNVSYRYPGGDDALTEITLRIYRGESLAVLGANGCGKSTLLKLLDGLLFAREGTILAFGETLNETNLAREEFNHFFRRQVGFVFQNSEAQLFNPTVWDEIIFGPLQMNLSEAEVRRRGEEIIQLLGLERIKNRPTFKLSGGEKKKVALASVLVTNPEVLLLDEPTSGLDPRTRRWLINFIGQLRAAGKTIVTATHDLDVVGEIACRALVLNEEHRLTATGEPEEIFRNRELLIEANLIDESFHRHLHADGHRHYHTHEK